MPRQGCLKIWLALQVTKGIVVDRCRPFGRLGGLQCSSLLPGCRLHSMTGRIHGHLKGYALLLLLSLRLVVHPLNLDRGFIAVTPTSRALPALFQPLITCV